MKKKFQAVFIIAVVAFFSCSTTFDEDYEVLKKSDGSDVENLNGIDPNLSYSFSYNGKTYSSNYIMQDSLVVFTDAEVNNVWNLLKEKKIFQLLLEKMAQ